MDDFIIDQHNQYVENKDDVYLLGDFVFGEDKQKAAHAFLTRMRGRKHWILGNHDNRAAAKSLLDAGLLSGVYDYLEVSHQKQRIVLSHYPFLTWNSIRHGSWCLHGHCHGQLGWIREKRILDVGVDTQWDKNHTRYAPYSFDEIKHLMATKTILEEVGSF